MKKLVFMFVAVAEEVVDSIAEVVDSVVDSLAADSVVADSAAVAE